MGASLLVGEGGDPAVGGKARVFVGTRSVKGAAQVGRLATVELNQHAQDGRSAVPGARQHADGAQTADFPCSIAPVAVDGVAWDVDQPVAVPVAHDVDSNTQ